MLINAIDRRSGAVSLPRKPIFPQISESQASVPVDRVELNPRVGKLNGLHVGLTVMTNFPMSVVTKREGLGITFNPKNENEDMREVFEGQRQGLKKNGPKSGTVKNLLNNLLGYYIGKENRKPLMLQLEKIAFRENDGKGKSLQSFKYGSSMAFDPWRVTLPDGKESLDYVNRNNHEIRLTGVGKLQAKYPTSVNGKKFRY